MVYFEEAEFLGGPFEGGHGLASITDYRDTKMPLKSEVGAAEIYNDMPTLERPFLLEIAGNDDYTWGRVFATFEEAQIVLQEILKDPSVHSVNTHLGFTN